MKSLAYVGMDVRKASYRLCCFLPSATCLHEGFAFAPAGIVDMLTRFAFSYAFQFEFL